MPINVIDYDRLDEWSPWVGEMISGLGDGDLLVDLARSQPEYIEDARDWLDERLGRERVNQAVVTGLCPYGVRFYHGTRLTDGELDQVREHGLKPLKLADRADRIAEILRLHPRWAEVEDRLPQAIVRFGPQARAGRREDGCVHACFSRSGLLLGCSHYLTYGAEVDGHIAHHLFGNASAAALFHRERKPYHLVRSAVRRRRAREPFVRRTRGWS